MPVEFESYHIENIVDQKSQKSLLITIDLIIVVMLNNDDSLKYIENITNKLSESAKEDIMLLIERSKNRIDGIIDNMSDEESENINDNGDNVLNEASINEGKKSLMN